MKIEPAVADADIIILAVPIGSIPSLKSPLHASIRLGAVLIDSGNYYPTRDGRIEPLDKGMPDSVWVAETLSLPEVHVVKIFNNIIASHIADHATAKGSPKRSALPLSGDDEEAMAVAATLVDSVGFDALNAGRLLDSWRQQPGQPAYCTEPTLKELPSLLSRANREQGPVNRDRGQTVYSKLGPGYSNIMMRVARLSAGIDKWNPRNWGAAVFLVTALLRAYMSGTKDK